MKKALKMISVLLICAVLTASFAACTSENQTADNPKEITDTPTETADSPQDAAGNTKETADSPKKIKVLIVPKFEIDGISGDFPGEAQLFYEEYCPGAEKIILPGFPDTAEFYYNEKNETAVLITGSGKTAAALALTGVLHNRDYDLSEAYVVSVGCGGGSCDNTTLGDVVLVTAACDNELGHTADIREFDDSEAEANWFYDNSYDSTAYKAFDSGLAAEVYGKIKDIPLYTTDKSREIIESNFAGEDWRLRDPKVLKGTALSGDSYWKGIYGHKNAKKIIKTYGASDPYMVTEMEELTVANVLYSFGMLDRLISLRVVVDFDIFLDGDSPEGLWSGTKGYNESVDEQGSGGIDIFETGMHNLFDVSKVIIDGMIS